MRIIVIANNRQFADPAEPYSHVAAGLRTLGHNVEVVAKKPTWPLWQGRADVAVVWNGVKRPAGAIADRARQAGAKVLVMERGFFDRMAHTQLDFHGFNHRASWASRLGRPAPIGGAERFRQVWGTEPTPMRSRRDGYILVLGQVSRDAQVRDSEIHHAGPLAQAVEDAAPRDVDIRIRPHPLARWCRPADARAAVIEGDLRTAIAGARFVVTINSNAGNEALAWGCPVLCFGPSLYGMAGVALQTHLVDMPASIRLMLDGWRPPRDMTANTLAHLACRQWSRGELARGTVLKRLLDDIE